MKQYGIVTFGRKQDDVIIKLSKIKLVDILKAHRYSDPITEEPIATVVDVKTFYVIAKILTYIFAKGIVADDICRNNLRKMDLLAETDDGVRRLLYAARSINGVFKGNSQ